jgi:serine/threonine-protein kinase
MSLKADLVAQPSCAVGTLIGGEYEVGQLIARGGVGEVYRVTHRTLQAELALKVLLPEHRDREDVRLRFRTEGRALWEISHPNFVKVHHAGEDAAVGPFLVMELLRGRSLAALLARAAIPFEQAIALTIQLAEATQAMHELEMIHRDLKPANVFLVAVSGGEVRAKLLDLGAAKIAKYGTPPTAEHLTLGTGRYMSPEHIACQPLSPASDVYSLAQIAFEMLTRSHPFDPAVTSPTSFDFQQWHLHQQPRRLSELCEELPEEVSDVLFQAMSKSRTARFQSMTAFARALGQAMRIARNSLPNEPLPSPPMAGGTHKMSAGELEGPSTEATPPPFGERDDGVVAYWVWLQEGASAKSFPLRAGELHVGRSERVEVRLEHPSVSSKHARLLVHPNGIVELFDEGAKGGTWLNDRAAKYGMLRHGDRVRLGQVVCELRLVDARLWR